MCIHIKKNKNENALYYINVFEIYVQKLFFSKKVSFNLVNILYYSGDNTVKAIKFSVIYENKKIVTSLEFIVYFQTG